MANGWSSLGAKLKFIAVLSSLIFLSITLSAATPLKMTLYLPLNSSSGSSATDYSGYQYAVNGTLKNMADSSWVAGKCGGGLRFSSTDPDYILLPKPSYFNHAQDYLDIPTYDGSNQAVHPSVVYIPTGWNGYKYWMAMSPYPLGDDTYENPSIVVSNDGLHWSNIVTNPLSPYPGGANYNNDPALYFNGTTMFLYWGTVTSIYNVSVRTSNDGVNWAAKRNVLNTTLYNLLSPSITKANKEFRMYGVDTASGCTSGVGKLLYYNSSDGFSWAGPYRLNFSAPFGLVLWHIDVQYIPGLSKYFMVYFAYDNTTANCGNKGPLMFAQSSDGKTWTTFQTPLMYDASENVWDSFLYKAGFVYDNSSNQMKIWYSAYDNSLRYHIGYTNASFSRWNLSALDQPVAPFNTPEGTLCYFIDISSSDNEGDGIFGDRYSSGNGQYNWKQSTVFLYDDSSYFGIRNSTSEVYNKSATVSPGVFQHYCLAWNSTQISIYKNGTLQGTTKTNQLSQKNDNFEEYRIGTYYTGETDYSFDGVLDEVVAFNLILNSTQMNAVYNCNYSFALDKVTTTTTTSTSTTTSTTTTSTSTLPSLYFTPPTPANGTVLNKSFFSVNATINGQSNKIVFGLDAKNYTVFDAAGVKCRVSINFDDGYKSALQIAKPILDRYGMNATEYVIILDTVYDNQSLNLTDLAMLYNSGWDVSSHTVSHPYLASLSAADLDSELKDSHDYLINNGFLRTAGIIAYPYGNYNDEVIAATKKYYYMARTTDTGINPQPLTDDNDAFYKISTLQLQNTTTLSDIKSYIDAAIAQKAFLVLTFHNINETPSQWFQKPTILEGTASYLKNKSLSGDLEVVTMSQYYALAHPVANSTLKKINASSYNFNANISGISSGKHTYFMRSTDTSGNSRQTDNGSVRVLYYGTTTTTTIATTTTTTTTSTTTTTLLGCQYGGVGICGISYCCGAPDGVCPSQFDGVSCSAYDSDCSGTTTTTTSTTTTTLSGCLSGGAKICGIDYCCGAADGVCPSNFVNVTCSNYDSDC